MVHSADARNGLNIRVFAEIHGLSVLGSLSTAVAQLWLSGELWRWGRRSASRRIRSLNFGTPIASRT